MTLTHREILIEEKKIYSTNPIGIEIKGQGQFLRVIENFTYICLSYRGSTVIHIQWRYCLADRIRFDPQINQQKSLCRYLIISYRLFVFSQL